MVSILVTGGTGMLGSHLVPLLVARVHQVRVLSRHATLAAASCGATAAVGDVRMGAGLHEAVAGIDTVIHAATNVRRRAEATEVNGTRHVLEAATNAGVRHVIYMSIVGVDRHRFPYYKSKWAAEQIVEAAPVAWTIQRATQFHDLIDRFMGLRIFPATRSMAFQPIDVSEVSERLAGLVDEGPAGRVPDLGGPEILPVRVLSDIRLRVTGARTVVLPVPRLGFLRDFDDGVHLAPDNRYGRTTWRDWLSQGT
jgi:uncharacterized protein YbjT (DUF2867 family)